MAAVAEAAAPAPSSKFVKACEGTAHCINRLRIVPRIIVGGYGYLIWDVVQWFMALPEPTTQQAALITTLTGVSVAVFGFYMQGGVTNKGGGK